MKIIDWQATAQAYAKAIDGESRQIRWGHSYHFYRRVPYLCILDNHPFAYDPSLRSRTLERFRKFCVQEGIEEMACGTYGNDGDLTGGYTMVIVLDVRGDDGSRIYRVYRDMVHDGMLTLRRDVAEVA
jgi:hypothetical protein